MMGEDKLRELVLTLEIDLGERQLLENVDHLLFQLLLFDRLNNSKVLSKLVNISMNVLYKMIEF